MQLKRVVVTGLGAITPLGSTFQEYWDNLVKGVSGAGPITRFDASKFKTHFACEIKDFKPEDHFDRKEIRRLDIFTQFALIATTEAVAHAKLEEYGELDKDRVGVIMGSGIGGIHTLQEEIKNYVRNDLVPKFNPFLVPKMICDIAVGHISMKYGYRGPNFTTVSACASSTHAMIDAFNYIRLGKADVILTGGAEASVNETSLGGFTAMNALSNRNDDPSTASRPFDKDRNGFVMGEGAGTLIFEEYEHAKKRGATIYAEVVGGGLTADAYHLTAPHPDGLGATNVMKMALEDANIKPEDIDYVNVHGTATPLGDLAESKAIQKVFGEHAYNLNISSTKSMTGHLLGAAGAVEALALIGSILYSKIPPTINHFTDDPELDNKLNFTFNTAQDREVNYALSNTFGFGGHNASVILKKYTE